MFTGLGLHLQCVTKTAAFALRILGGNRHVRVRVVVIEIQMLHIIIMTVRNRICKHLQKSKTKNKNIVETYLRKYFHFYFLIMKYFHVEVSHRPYVTINFKCQRRLIYHRANYLHIISIYKN